MFGVKSAGRFDLLFWDGLSSYCPVLIAILISLSSVVNSQPVSFIRIFLCRCGLEDVRLLFLLQL
jgi:hypothetical protein